MLLEEGEQVLQEVDEVVLEEGKLMLHEVEEMLLEEEVALMGVVEQLVEGAGAIFCLEKMEKGEMHLFQT